MTKAKNIIGAKVQFLRNKQKLTQEQFASRCQVAGWDISRGTLAKIESGVRCVGDDELWWLAKILKTPISELYPSKVPSPRLHLEEA